MTVSLKYISIIYFLHQLEINLGNQGLSNGLNFAVISVNAFINWLTRPNGHSLMVVSVRTYVRTYVQEQVRTYTYVQNKLMTDYAVGPGGSLNSLDLSYIFFAFGVWNIKNHFQLLFTSYLWATIRIGLWQIRSFCAKFLVVLVRTTSRKLWAGL